MTRQMRGGGMVIVASSREPDPSKLPKPTKECFVVWRSWFKRRYECGHCDSRRFSVSIYGDTSKVVKQFKLCSECFIDHMKQHTITCALCGLSIIPGEPVALYDADNEGIRDDATREGDSVLGCLRWECGPGAAFFAGHWSEDGFKGIDWSKFAVWLDLARQNNRPMHNRAVFIYY